MTHDNRNTMWLLVLLYLLGLRISQADGQDNSTQMYYVKLTIEESAIGNITELLRPFVKDTNLHVDNLEMTTTCKNVTAGKVCNCKSSFKWSDEVCKSKRKCCENDKCILPKSSSHMCVSNNTVTVSGNLSLKGLTYEGCLANKQTKDFKRCDNKLSEEMKTVYSTLRGFDVLTIKSYRTGSIIVNFEMTIAYGLKPKDLEEKTILLVKKLKAEITLKTEGVVRLHMPPNPVHYNSQVQLICTVKVNLNVTPVWQLQRDREVFDIYSGTEADVMTQTLQTTIALKSTSALWAGEYSCLYRQNPEGTSVNIIHQATAVLDVCLLPNIYGTTSPSFPRCQTSSDLQQVQVKCEIDSSDEQYTVEWTKDHITAGLTEVTPSPAQRPQVYAVNTVVSCASNAAKPQVNCTFKNRCNQTRSASVEIHIIQANDKFCKAEDDWQDTKAGFTAELRCKDEAGWRRRLCKENGNKEPTWEPEVRTCVNRRVDNVLQKAKIVDIGRGSLDGNTAKVFSLLGNVTNDTKSISSPSNINASVQVLFTLSEKKENLTLNETVANDFLDSSSNLLDRSHTESWTTSPDKDNVSLAERYLQSVEDLIRVANITSVRQKKNIEVASKMCSKGSQCTNRVFNVTIALDGDNPGSVKSAGFQELESYLPNNEEDFQPNSIVVSTTTERNISDSVEVTITFPLLKPRPRNVEIQCVSWDFKNKRWSTNQCEWQGRIDEGQCVCRHLSSFAILMSKYPLKIPLITEITYAALATSIVSLIISLVIEVAVWSAVVKTNTLYLRHTAHINISLCLLIADICFLASSKPDDISPIWCQTFVVLKHFCYLSMFFWMFCLSTTLLHQAVFPFHSLSKKNYLRFSLTVGYVVPLLIVTITFLANKAGAEGHYYSKETCWLVYNGLMKGSIHTFVLPVGIIVFVNVFCMLVVILKLLDHPKIAEASGDKEKRAAVTVMRSVILLTPVFGVTWLFGFAVMFLDLTYGVIAYLINYTFTLLNAFQGLFILLTICVGDKLTREALLRRLKGSAPASTTDSTMKSDSPLKK